MYKTQKINLATLFFLILLSFSNYLNSQTFSPINITGFNFDAVAETPPNSLASTTQRLDAAGSNMVFYSANFATTMGFGGGLPNSGTIVTGLKTYQLRPYNVSNTIFVPTATNRTITLSTPSNYSKLSFLLFSTEGTSTMSITVNYTNLTSTSFGNFVISDWFGGVNFAISNLGRCSRVANVVSSNGLPNNPRIYFLDINLSCADQLKNISSIVVRGIAGNIGTYIMAVSGATPPTPILTINSATICAGNSATLAANGATNYTWSPTTNLSSATGSVVVANPSSTTTYSVIGANGSCPATANSTVTVVPNPTISVSSGSICSGSSLTLTANGATNYTWSPPTDLSSSTGSVVVANPNSTTIYSVLGANGSCSATANSTVTVIPNPIISVNSGSICSGSSLTLTANGATNYTWSPTTDLSSATGSVVVANPSSTTIYSVLGANGSCKAIASSTVDVTTTPTLSVNSGAICSGSSLTLTANGATNYTWSPTTDLSSATGNVVVANPSSTTIYSVLGANGSCTAIATSTVDVTTTPTLTVNSGSICSGSSLTLTANGATNYTWSPTTNLSSSTGSVVVANPSSTTIYSVLGANGSCTAIATSTVDVTTTPTLSVNSGSICSGSSLTLTANGATNYTWSPTTNLSSSAGSVVVANPSSTTIYSVLGANGSCTAIATSTVDVTTTPTLSVNSGSICSGSSLTLTASGATNYTWSPTTNLSSSTGSVVVANPNSTTIYSVIGANGSCTATATSTVGVNSNPTITVNSSTICAGQQTATLAANGASTYSWIPTTNLSAATGSLVTGTPITTENYTVVGIDLNGCLGSATATIVVNAIPNIIANSSTICAGQQTATLTANGASTYSWIPSTNLSAATGSLVTGTPASTENYTIVGTDANGCISAATSTITVNPLPVMTITPNATVCPLAATTLSVGGASIYTWSPNIFLNNANSSNVIATPSITTSYTVDGLSSSGCSNSIVMTLIVNNSVVVNASAASPTICPQANTTLTASGATSYTWSPSLNLSSANGSVVIASPPSTTTYTVIGSTSTCTNSAEVVVTITANPTLSIVSSPSIICSGNLSTLSASGANTYTWSPAATLNSSNGSNVNANPITTTIYSVSGANAFGCLSSTTATLSVVTTPTITAIANPSSICPGQTSTLSAFGASNYTWSPSITITNPNSSSTIASPALTTIYNVIGSIGNTSFLCTSSNTVQLTVIPVPTITVSPQIVICEGQSTTIYAAGANSYTWSPAIGLTNPYSASTNLNPTGSGTFIYTVTAVNINCAATETVEVIVNPLPIINAGPDAIINIDNTLVLFGTGNTEVGFISTEGIPLSCNYCYSLTVNPQNNTCYTLEGINNFGCRTTDDICVTVTKDWDVFIPNAFTPNGDKNNELFIPVGYGITEMRLTIFDRWGNLIFKSNGETIGWDGKKNGQLCEQGVYIYQAEITSISGTNLKKTGHVTLLTRVK